MMIVLGVLYTFVPSVAVKLIGVPGERKPTTWFVLIPLLIVGWLVYLWVKMKIEAYGYRF